MKIAVAGTGYVGLVTAAVLAHIGHFVTCVDVDKNKIELLNSGGCTFFEPGLDGLLTANRERLLFTMDAKEAYRDADVIFVAAGTPEKADGSANLKYVYDVIGQIASCAERDCLVTVKSTVPVGTNDKLQLRLDKKSSVKIEVVSNPEFLSQGTAVKDMLHASRIVIGAESEHAKQTMARVYEKLGLPVIATNRCSAELIKYASNDFLALKISYINEIANLCEIFGADIGDVAKGMGMDPRIGDKFLSAGIGYGGSCFPKDTKALHWLSNFHDNELKTIKAAVEVNANQKLKLVKKAKKYYKSFEGLNVAVLGLSFKPGTDDLREAPSLDNIRLLLEDGAIVRAWDPVACENFKKHYPSEITYCGTIEEAIADADICLIFTEWNEVKHLDPRAFLKMKTPVILDGRNCFELERMDRYPVVYDSIGRRAAGCLHAGSAHANLYDSGNQKDAGLAGCVN